MKKVVIFVLMLLLSTVGYTQTQQSDIEKNVETAAVSIRSALLNNPLGKTVWKMVSLPPMK